MVGNTSAFFGTRNSSDFNSNMKKKKSSFSFCDEGWEGKSRFDCRRNFVDISFLFEIADFKDNGWQHYVGRSNEFVQVDLIRRKPFWFMCCKWILHHFEKLALTSLSKYVKRLCPHKLWKIYVVHLILSFSRASYIEFIGLKAKQSVLKWLAMLKT